MGHRDAEQCQKTIHIFDCSASLCLSGASLLISTVPSLDTDFRRAYTKEQPGAPNISIPGRLG